MGVHEIKTPAEFEEKVIASGKPVVVDFFATWCGPCKAVAPAIEKFSNENQGVEFYKVDVDELQSVAADLGVSAMPTFAFFKDGQQIKELTVRGANPGGVQNGLKALLA
ncbi:thioredoxin [Aspergillus pseudonomiae]|uniref:Thioredoxin n=1 Tax=Aspergillus pseudonomiae TaxID=1506151 RepID=A0A5N7DG54_9EURO|nr:thioredoxin [Aspergillus pseudonomiae]KAB8258659.1 thioredoxin [Aspergillus pseudonomiae]KAE8405412.1 thioredoxin [Aspergillus pseudonomiae]